MHLLSLLTFLSAVASTLPSSQSSNTGLSSQEIGTLTLSNTQDSKLSALHMVRRLAGFLHGTNLSQWVRAPEGRQGGGASECCARPWHVGSQGAREQGERGPLHPLCLRLAACLQTEHKPPPGALLSTLTGRVSSPHSPLLQGLCPLPRLRL